MSSILV